MPFADVKAIRTHYRIEGSGPPLLLLAPGGFRSVISRWTPEGATGVWKEMGGLDTLARHFTCIAYDRRESGLSGGRVEPLTWQTYADEACALLDVAGVKDAYILGCCMGVSIAAALAARYPERCRGLLLYWPVGGYRWKRKTHEYFDRHTAFVKAHGLQAVVDRAAKGENFWLDPEIGPWGSPAAVYPEFAAEFVRQDVDRYLDIVARSRDQLFPDTMPSGASGDELMAIQTPAVIMPGADAAHATSAAWAMAELMPRSEFWNVLPKQQTGANTLEQILKLRDRLEATQG